MQESPRPRRTRRILVPLATLAAAGALTIGSGANFTSTSKNPASMVASGTLTQSNSKADAAIFNVNNIKPGDTVVGEVKITNTGTLPANFSLTETVAANTFVNKSMLQLVVSDATGTIYSGAFGSLGSTKSVGTTLKAGEARTYKFAVTLSPDATNDEQGKSASATYTWDAVQTSAVTVTQGADTPATATNANP
jgi:hypothetical protein